MILNAGISRGLTLSDFDEMTLGQVIDFITVYNNMNSQGEFEENEDSVEVQEANQLDFDNF